MPEVDAEILLNANKGLTIGFIICICIINILLIIKTAFKNWFLYSPKYVTIISLALGDIFLALYSLVIYCRIVFESINLGCRLMVSYYVYLYWVIHSVYGIGLIVLAVELVIRYKQRFVIKKTCSSILIAVTCGMIPWIVGLAVVLPVTLVGFDWDTCRQDIESDRVLARHYASVIIPAGLAVIVCIVVCCIPLTPRAIMYGTETHTRGMVIHTNNAPSVIPVNVTTVNSANPYQTDKSGSWNNSFVNTATSNSTTSHHVSGEPRAFVPVPDYDQAEPIVVGAGREKIVLLITAILFFLCVVPLAAWNMYILLGNVLTDLSLFAITFLSQAFLWLSVFRSLITPLIWLGCSSRF
ncbi:unnamed protein product [Candidula unifasciata]|uniref:G-protein coupled receptors family 1 profile domain-containing protein n=1 Tax=Candidula unifasciata TaxID=100452 RepID=A0A8S3YLU6_9EUPU|nr:unnamed protein product [Candidula unifasciata]